jgi:hypothetical protein
MKTTRIPTLLAAALVGALTSTAAHAQAAPKMKMSTDIPSSITTPDEVQTRLGTLKFTDGFPDDATVQKVYAISISSTPCRRILRVCPPSPSRGCASALPA